MAAKKKSRAKKQKPASRKVRSLRHWKQRWDPNAAFVFRRVTDWDGTRFEAGDLVPEEFIAAVGRTKLRRWWESQRIELAEFEAPVTSHGMPVVKEAPVPSEVVPELREEAVEGEGDGPQPAPESD